HEVRHASPRQGLAARAAARGLTPLLLLAVAAVDGGLGVGAGIRSMPRYSPAFTLTSARCAVDAADVSATARRRAASMCHGSQSAADHGRSPRGRGRHGA